MTTKSLSLLIGSIAWAATLGAQVPLSTAADTTRQTTPYGLQVTSQLVSLDIVVTDKRGEPVTGLSVDDFEVYENKVRQKVQTFEPSAAVMPASVSSDIHSTADLDRLAPQAPVSIIVLDEVTLQFEDEAFTRFAMQKYLASEGERLSLPTLLMAVSPEHQMVLHDYTTSKKELLAALDSHFAHSSWNAKNPHWSGKLFMASTVTLIGVANAAAAHPGHKNIIWIGRGFPNMPWDQLPTSEAHQFKDALAICTNRLRDARATLYRVDPAGASAGQPVTHADAAAFVEGIAGSAQIDDPFGDQADFDAMANATGGQALYGRNDVDKLIGNCVRNGRIFYTLTYRPSESGDTPAAFRSVHVVVKKPDLVASTRLGYFAGGFPDTPDLNLADIVPKQASFDLGMAADGLLIYDAVPLTIEATNNKPGQFRITLPASAVHWSSKDGKQSCQLTVLMASYDAKNHLLHREGRVVDLETPLLADGQPETRALHILMTTPIVAQAARLRIIVQDSATAQIGATNYSFQQRHASSVSSTEKE